MSKYGFALATTVLLPLAAAAQPAPNCAPRETVVARLASTYGETRQSIDGAVKSGCQSVRDNYFRSFR
jgi:hypothetical protein